MKLSFFKLLKFYFITLAAVVVLGFVSLFFLVPQMNRSKKQLQEHPYVRERILAGFQIVDGCGSYVRRWRYELTAICLEKASADSSGGRPKLLHEVVTRQTGSSVACEYRVVTPTDTLCLPKP